jgi:ABC-2 type transport system permease protein
VSSRALARRIDATPDVAVAMVLPDLPSAEHEVFARSIYGILLIPKDFERDLLHGRSSPIALYADASYFLMYQRMAAGIAAVAQTFAAEVQAPRLIGLGVAPPWPRPSPTRCRSPRCRCSTRRVATRRTSFRRRSPSSCSRPC